MKISESTNLQMPLKTVVSLIVMVSVGTWAYFGVVETLNQHNTTLELMEKDLTAANEFITGVPKGDMVSPQINELFMLVEFISGNQEKLKAEVGESLPGIKSLELQVEFLEQRLIKAEEVIDKLRANGGYDGSN
jgi:hypothetical protein|tara:strand:- start:399 stop:800 length:402 start_codon:yes stop_codon:yes gene_type:complete